MSGAIANGPATEIAGAAFIVGPTGSGKSALALDLADELDAEIVNADSRLFYRGLDIGTAKPSAAERSRVRHHLVDIRDPDDPVDVAAFLALARAAFAEIASRGKRVLVVGGSGLYLRVLRRGMSPTPPGSLRYRDHLRALADRNGIAYLHGELAKIDPAAAARISQADFMRIARALEVFHLTGTPLSVHHRLDAQRATPGRYIVLGLAGDRAQLYESLDRRFDAMITAGLVDEVRGLLAHGYRPDRAPLATIGYKQIAAYLGGRMALDEAIATAQRETRHLAKRQLTWFRGENDIVWIDAADPAPGAGALLRNFFSSSPPEEAGQARA